MMVSAANTRGPLDASEQFEREWVDNGSSWIAPIRKAAIARFSELGFPGTAQEEWRLTNVDAIARTLFSRAGHDTRGVTRSALQPFLLNGAACGELVYVNGRYAPELSSAASLPDGVRVAALADIVRGDPTEVRAHLQGAAGSRGAAGHAWPRGQAPATLRSLMTATAHLARHANYRDHAFVALNTAYLEDGAFVDVAKGMTIERPIHLLFISTAGAEPTVSHPRILVVADRQSRVCLVESYVGLGAGVYFTNAVTEIVALEDAVVDHYRVQRESEEAFHIGTIQLDQGPHSRICSHSVSVGGRLVRNDIHAVLGGAGCECTLNGFFMAHDRQHVDHHLRIEHVGPHTSSREFYKGILDDESRGVFSGRIVVRPGAQKTDAKQTNMNLLLTDQAQIDTQPQLEIFADDVKCTHGATIGQVDDEAIFYVRSRGIDKASARSLLVQAFASESLDRIGVEPLRQQLRGVLLSRLSQEHLCGRQP